MKKLALLAFMAMLIKGGVSFNSYGCKVITPGQSITLGKDVPCLVIDSSKDVVYWVRMEAIPIRTGDPQLDQALNNMPRALNYVGCDTYREFSKEEGCKFCKNDFSTTEFKVGQVLWYLVVGNNKTDFCYVSGGVPMKVDTIVVKHQDDAGSGRDASHDSRVMVGVNKIYQGFSANDYDWYVAKLPKEKLIKFSITYTNGPEGKRKLLYGLGSGGPTENYFTYCTASHKLVSSLYRDGSRAWYSAFFPGVGETAYCYLKFKKKKPEDPDYILFPFFVKPPLQYPPPDEEGKPKEQYKLPEYSFSFEVIEENKKK
ncbi:MAG: hypothetical protein J7L62_02180 [Candidatus Aminicenantes bacterium]|nr:hypothetical protein [Candidatus Aminicenantes bacterium]